jgi:hypothetical protein
MITIIFQLGIFVGFLMGIAIGSAGSIVGLRLLYLAKSKKTHNKKEDTENIIYKDINFLNTKFDTELEDVG